MKRLFNLTLLFCVVIALASCGEDSNREVCPGVKVSVAGSADDDLYIKGGFNNWSLSTPMTFSDGRWEVELFLAPGDYPYKFHSKKDNTSDLDPENPLTMFDSGIRYSRLMVKDCRYPAIKLEKKPVVDGKAVSFEMKYSPGIADSAPDMKKTVILLNRQEANYTFDDKNNVFKIEHTALENGKYTWSFKVFDKKGFAADVQTVQFWIEDKDFNWRDAMMYQLMTDRFKNGSTDNDNPLPEIDEKANWQGGDFRGIIEKIEDNYFSDLGFNAIWISSPVLNTPNPGKGMGGDKRYYAAYHSYWPIATGWTDVNPIPGMDSPIETRFGTAEELHELIQKAHSKGIRVLFDFVPNHVHTDAHLWQTYKNLDWFHFATDGQSANSNGGYTCGWEKPVECWFTDYLADLDYTNIDAMNAVIDHLLWMIQEFDIDGLRLDAIRLMRIDFTTTLRTAIERNVMHTGVPFYMIGETFTGDTGWEEIGLYVGETKLNGQFDFPLYHHVVRTFLLQSETVEELSEFLEENDGRYERDYYLEALMGNFIGNHDVCRALSLANDDFDGVSSQGGAPAHEKVWENSPVLPTDEDPFKKMRNALSFIYTMPGIPIVYQGDEFGMPGANDPDNRRMNIFDDGLSEFQKKNLEHLRLTAKFRSQHKSLRYGKRTVLKAVDNILAFSYVLDDDVAVVVFNNSEEDLELKLELDGVFDIATVRDALSEKSFDVKNGSVTLTIPSFSSMLLDSGVNDEN